jgi:hypothetical protein
MDYFFYGKNGWPRISEFCSGQGKKGFLKMYTIQENLELGRSKFSVRLGNAHCVTIITTATMQAATRSPHRFAPVTGLDGRGAQPWTSPRHASPRLVMTHEPRRAPFHSIAIHPSLARQGRERMPCPPSPLANRSRAHRHRHQATREKKRKSRASTPRRWAPAWGRAVALSTLSPTPRL